jgi:hypothetical protein
MRKTIIGATSTLVVLLGLSLYSLGRPPQDRDDMRREPHMAAAMEHLRAARAELDQATPNKGGHRERAIKLVDDAIHQVQDGMEYYEHHHH